MAMNMRILLLMLVVLVICMPGNGVYAFGAGNIPGFAYMEGKAFRHGDIEDALAKLIKRGSGGGALFGLMGKSKFGGLDIKRVYFGNWLRDYSQAVDIAGLKKLQLQTIINLCMALGFLAHGYATGEFEVTEERLGVYLPTEHIDNPKGYGEGEDARQYNPKLRGPVDPRELEVDPQTGMKNYIANENGPWDTSKALVRRTMERCIHIGRQHRAQGKKEDEYEAYRLLGQLMHTLEDFPAHSNFCELALAAMGHNVFVHVGDQVRIHAPNGKMVAPLVTGTFGSSDFIHSLLGEATDHISEASVSDLNKELDKARSRSGPGGSGNNLRELVFQLPGGSGGEMSREMDGIERIRAGPSQGGKRPEDMSPQELHAVLWQVLTFRDSIVKRIEATIEKIPGLGPLIEKLMESIQVFIFTTLEPYLKPILKTATTGLMSASGEVINNHDQYEVFNDPRASDPTHSFLSKDHFNLILNEPAGNLAKVIVNHTVINIVRAWDDNSVNVRQVTEEVLECLFHPDFHNPNSSVQREMMQYMRDWVGGLRHTQHTILERLSKEAVRNHRNIRLGGEGGENPATGGASYNAALNAQNKISGYVNQIPGVHQAQSIMNVFSGPPGSFRDAPGMTGAGYAPPPGPPTGNFEPLPSSGEAASFYQSGTPSYGTPSGPPPPVRHDSRPPFPSEPQSSYGGGPPPMPSYPQSPPIGTPQHGQGPQSGYTPSYAPPSFPGSPGGGGPGGFPSPDVPYSGSPHGGYAPPPGPPSFPSPGGPPPGPPGQPQFPGSSPYGAPPGAPPQFPGAPGYYHPPYGGPPTGGW
ncbi:Het-C-domain-containing protein [Rickenella mellea]|uniref:Het-C-domain-containing protein n=1 Tax=Rickenella mellea TaxID=50990 RepID=A0A4Y7PW41_9AGAM|nr:Het-C-domain-containing protein [Rickenella mellea]